MSGDKHRAAGGSTRGGFTLTEVMVASGLMMVLTLVIFESVLFANRMAYDVKSRLAADAIAFDTAWGLFNRQLLWFQRDASAEAIWRWEAVDAEDFDVWGERTGEVLVYSEITPEGFPATNWVIRVRIQWPKLAGGGVTTLPPQADAFYEVNRLETDRNLFRARR